MVMVMAQKIVESYLNELPRELIKAINPLSNKKDLALYVCILKEGPFRFSELKEKFGAHQQEISSALNSLMVAGLIEKRSDISEEGFAEISYYSVSPLGESMMRSLVKGALFIDSYPDCLRRVGKCTQETNANPSLSSKLTDSGSVNIWRNYTPVEISGGSIKNKSVRYHSSQKPERRLQYEPKKA